MSIWTLSEETLTEMAAHISTVGGTSVTGHEIVRGELIVRTTPGALISLIQTLRDEPGCLFQQLIDVSAVDYPERPERFEVVYQLLSLRHNRRVRVKLAVDEATPVPTLIPLFSSAGWFEREVWDMFGITFDGHPDLRRILTDYGFDGHPLRKDFPLTGFVEVRYDDEIRRVVYEPVKLVQDFRVFDNLSPWEGMTTVQLPGDEKATKPKTGWSPVVVDVDGNGK